MYVAIYIMYVFMKHLVIMTKKSNLSYDQIWDTSIIQRFSRNQTCHIEEVGLHVETNFTMRVWVQKSFIFNTFFKSLYSQN